MTTRRALGLIRPSRGGFLLLGVIVAAVAVATYAIAQGVAGGEARSASVPVAHRPPGFVGRRKNSL